MKRFHSILFVLAVLLIVIETGCCNRARLEQVTIVSRHGVRVPLEKYMADLDNIISEESTWPTWPVEGGHLSLRGSVLEYMAGEYYRNYFKDNGLRLTPGAVYFCASPKQRTVETSRAFAAGLFPGQKIAVEFRGSREFNYPDPEFLPLLNMQASLGTFDTLAFQAEARREMDAIADSFDISEDLRFLEEVIGLSGSRFAAATHKKHFDEDLKGFDIFFTKNGAPREPAFRSTSDFNVANRASDALILQYYEQDDSVLGNEAGNPRLKDLSIEDWKRLARIKDVYGEILFTAPIVAVNVSHDMLGKVRGLLASGGKKLNFLCTHDSMMDALLTALQATHEPLPNTIEARTPIGFKIVLEKWKDKGRHYIRPYLAYYSTEQLRAGNPADLQGPPVKVMLSFKGLTLASNGMYRFEDFMQHLNGTYDAFDFTAKGQQPF